jgi:hypothetical protein
MFPGETLRISMWVVNPTKVVFQTRVVERGVVAISNAALEFKPGKMVQQQQQGTGVWGFGPSARL